MRESMDMDTENNNACGKRKKTRRKRVRKKGKRQSLVTSTKATPFSVESEGLCLRPMDSVILEADDGSGGCTTHSL